MIFLELFESIFEFKKVEAMVGIKIAEFEVLRDLLFLFEYFLDFGTTTVSLIHSPFH